MCLGVSFYVGCCCPSSGSRRGKGGYIIGEYDVKNACERVSYTISKVS